MDAIFRKLWSKILCICIAQGTHTSWRMSEVKYLFFRLCSLVVASTSCQQFKSIKLNQVCRITSVTRSSLYVSQNRFPRSSFGNYRFFSSFPTFHCCPEDWIRFGLRLEKFMKCWDVAQRYRRHFESIRFLFYLPDEGLIASTLHGIQNSENECRNGSLRTGPNVINLNIDFPRKRIR